MIIKKWAWLPLLDMFNERGAECLLVFLLLLSQISHHNPQYCSFTYFETGRECQHSYKERDEDGHKGRFCGFVEIELYCLKVSEMA